MIYNEDCIDGMKKLQGASADIIIADPPYNIGKDFGNASDKQDASEYLNWSSIWMSECERILKPTGTFYIYGFSETLAHLSIRLQIPHRWLVWHYTNKNTPHLSFWQRSHESILCAYKEKPIFNRDEVREEYTKGFLKGSAGKTRPASSGRFGNKTSTYNANPKGALPRDVIKVPTLAGGSGMNEKMIFCKDCDYVGVKKKEHKGHNIITHPTQKPVALTNKLIKAAKVENGTVVIPFCGSGSEHYSAIKNGMNPIAFEINPDYVELASRFILAT